jgi:hypothetical protein
MACHMHIPNLQYICVGRKQLHLLHDHKQQQLGNCTVTAFTQKETTNTANNDNDDEDLSSNPPFVLLHGNEIIGLL